MAEVTEATLLSVLKTAEALKQVSLDIYDTLEHQVDILSQKLAEHRAQREQQERVERELEEKRRNPPRLV